MAADRYRGYVAGQADRQITATASEVGHSVGAQLRRDGDLTITVRTLVETRPNLTNPDFVSWFAAMGVTERYPEALGFGFVEPVTPAQLPAYIAKAAADSVAGTKPAQPFQLSPPGLRPIYCLGRIGTTTKGLGGIFPSGFDACAGPTFSPGLWLAADTAQIVVIPISGNTFAIVAPVYRNQVVPASPSGRRAQLVAWTGGIFDAGPLLAAVSGDQHGLSLSLFRQNSSSKPTLVATSGKGVSGHMLQRTVKVQADGQWLIQVAAPAGYGALSPTVQGLAILLAGLAFSLLLFLLVAVLIGSRSRALSLVDEKTVELQHQALHDGLTGLPNRALILARVEQALARSPRHHTAVSAMFIDLDNFKDINDTFGHGVGDELLGEVAARLAGALRDSDTVGRLGGDEFVVLVEGDSLDDGPEVVAQRLLDVLRESFVLGLAGRIPCSISASVGVASGMDLRNALGDDQFFVLYHPTFDLKSATVTGVEALLRWRHPTRGVIQPDTFIPLAEETGMIIEIGRWVLQRATRQAAAWHAEGHPLNLSVNVSARQLESDHLADEVRRALATSGLDPACLTLEITETTLMRDTEATARRLTELKEIGVRIAIDDFGTGYSSLAYLRQFPVDTLKIDRSFISAMTSSTEAAALIHTLIQLGKNLGIETLAEGIEDQDQFTQLQHEQCESGQGFLVARPLEADAVPLFLETWAAGVGSGDGNAARPAILEGSGGWARPKIGHSA